MFLVLLASFLYLGGTLAAIPEGFILQVTPTCGATITDVTKVLVITDLLVSVEADCADGTTHELTSEDGVFYDGTFAFAAGHGPTCLFEKLLHTNTYRLSIAVAWGDPMNFILDKTEQYIVTCIYDVYGNQVADPKTVDKSLIGPTEIQENLGTAAASSFTLNVVDIAGAVVSDPYPMGKKVRIKATISGAVGEVGIRATSCSAVGANNIKYAILRGGCGDGIILRQDKGFKTTGLKVESPFFSAFYLKGSKNVHFECNFTTCTANCDGDSCVTVTRRRRGVSLDQPEEPMGRSFTASSKIMSIDVDDLLLLDQSQEVALADKDLPSSQQGSSIPPNNVLIGGIVMCVVSVLILIAAACCIQVQKRTVVDPPKCPY